MSSPEHKDLIRKAKQLLQKRGFEVEEEYEIVFPLTPSVEGDIKSKIAELHSQIKTLRNVLEKGVVTFRVDVVGQKGEKKVAVECGVISYRQFLVRYFPNMYWSGRDWRLTPEAFRELLEQKFDEVYQLPYPHRKPEWKTLF